ncbi:MAG: FHA domain-containing protein [Clostridia bacterium]|nr:FHA domain-containing protein [Clostridia bacterium]
MTLYLIIIGILVVAVLVIFALVIWLLNNREERRIKNTPHYRHDVIISGGVDISTGQRAANDHRYFNGMKGNNNATICLQASPSGRLHPVGNSGALHNITLVDTVSQRQYGATFVGEIIIGRAPTGSAASVIAVEGDGSISSKHCRILCGGEGFFIEDLGSSNHTYLNGRMLTSMEVLGNGDFLKMGKSEFQVYLG